MEILSEEEQTHSEMKHGEMTAATQFEEELIHLEIQLIVMMPVIHLGEEQTHSEIKPGETIAVILYEGELMRLGLLHIEMIMGILFDAERTPLAIQCAVDSKKHENKRG